MLKPSPYSELYAVNIREAQAIATSLSEGLASIDDTVARTREAIVESRRLIDRIDAQLAR